MSARARTILLLWGVTALAVGLALWVSRADAQENRRPNGSLWNKSSRSLVGDFRAHRVGDTITILVQETASASSSASTKTSRDDSVNFGGIAGSLAGLLRPFGIKRDLPGPFDVSAKNASNGQGQTNRSGLLVTKLTAVVKEVLPNGNLLIEGTRIVGVNAEKQKVVISGIIRPQDIGPDNTVPSIALANATIQYDGKGPVGEKQRRGLLSTIFGWLF